MNRPADYLPPAQLASLVALLWPDASQDNDSDIARFFWSEPVAFRRV